MLKTRVIPVMLIQDGYFVKTTKFKNPEYVGDPLNIVKIFSDKEADEITIYDIGSSVTKDNINYKLIENIASNIRMPLCYGGGITNIDQAEKLFCLGVEKISISRGFIKNLNFLNLLSEKFGSQSIVVTIDLDKDFNNNYIIDNYQTQKESECINFIKEISKHGVGEIIINCKHKDGTKEGYDLKLIDLIYSITNTPITIVGGANSYENIVNISKEYPGLGFGVGNLFIYKGKHNAVLISYPEQHVKKND